ncbi:MAG: response regulator [Pseudomonadota bacterium]
MTVKAAQILVVDDEAQNLTIIGKQLKDHDLLIDTASDGIEAWDKLQAEPTRYHAILLDRMMPNMDGMEVLARIKQDNQLRDIPVILQTARAAKSDVAEGIQAGAYYYLTKPFTQQAISAIVQAAVRDRKEHIKLLADLDNCNCSLELMDDARFQLRTVEHARELALTLAQACAAPTRVVSGLLELLTNAVEHGNLGIGYDTKTELFATGQWKSEIARRQQLEQYTDRKVEVSYERRNGTSAFVITDEGEGFDWQQYLEISPERGGDTHGRGIALSRMHSFSDVIYKGAGNSVVATLREAAQSAA